MLDVENVDSTVCVEESVFVATEIPGREELAVVSNTISEKLFVQARVFCMLLHVSSAQNAIAISSETVVVAVVFVLLDCVAVSLYAVRASLSSGLVGLHPEISKTPAELPPGVVVVHVHVTDVSFPTATL